MHTCLRPLGIRNDIVHSAASPLAILQDSAAAPAKRLGGNGARGGSVALPGAGTR